MLESLCRAAGGTAIGETPATTLLEQASAVVKMQKIAAAFVLQNVRGDSTSMTAVDGSSEAHENPVLRKERPMDIPLLQYALSHFAESLDKASVTSTAEATATQLPEVFNHLLEPVPVPSLTEPSATAPSGRRQSAKPSGDSSPVGACTYAGVLLQSSKELDVLSLILRAAICPATSSGARGSAKSKRKPASRAGAGGRGGKHDQPGVQYELGTLYSTLLGVVERCYGGTVRERTLSPAPAETQQKKRANSSTCTGASRKRRRTNDSAAVVVVKADDAIETATEQECV